MIGVGFFGDVCMLDVFSDISGGVERVDFF